MFLLSYIAYERSSFIPPNWGGRPRRVRFKGRTRKRLSRSGAGVAAGSAAKPVKLIGHRVFMAVEGAGREALGLRS